jgi:hypothetical protein
VVKSGSSKGLPDLYSPSPTPNDAAAYLWDASLDGPVHARSAAFLLVLLAISGCMGKGSTPPTTSSATAPTPPPNFLGDWSQAQGNYTLVLVETTVAAFNATTNASIPRNDACTAPYSYTVNRDNETLRLSRNYAIHPYDPGDLKVVFLNALVWNDRCVRRGYYGINENAGSPDICLYGVEGAEREKRIPWSCHLPLEPLNDVHAAVWLNVSVPLADGTHRIILNGHDYGPAESGSFTFWTQDPARGRRYESTVKLEVIGVWPYASITRG